MSCGDFIVLLRGDENDRTVFCDADHPTGSGHAWHGGPVPSSTDGFPFDGVSAPMLPLHATLEVTLPPHVGPRVEWRYRQ